MMNTLLMLSRFANKTFALWVIIAGILGFVFPDVFKPIGSWIAILLGVMMFGMGLTLTTADFREIFRRPKDVFVGILAQFLIESILISVTGGLIGVVFGVGAAVVVNVAAAFPIYIQPWSVFLSFAVCTLTGVFFGWYPAQKAAMLDPIEAIRYE